MAKSSTFDPGHHDRVTVLHANFNGTRILTASIDHRIKVWERDPRTGERTLLDTFTAHDSDVRDAKFLHPTLGTHLASIGNDLKFHLWSEDPSQAPRGGHRFRRVATIPSTPRVPFVSMDVRTLPTDHVSTFLALIDRQGLLSVYEPTNPDDLREWTLLDCFNVCAPSNVPGRGEETSFKVRFDPNPTPLAYINSVSNDRDQLSLVVCALNEVKIYRSVVPSHSGTGADASVGGIGMGIGSGTGVSSSGNASHRLIFYEALKLPTHPALVRDVAWAPFSVRGTDRIATAGKDGAVRVFELGVAEGDGTAPGAATESASGTGNGHRNGGAEQLSTPTPTRSMSAHQQQSSLTTQIASRHAATHPSSSSAHPGSANPARTGYTFAYTTTISSAVALSRAHTDAWSLTFDSQGQVLMSTGSDGVTKVWRKSVLGGQWMLFAGQEITENGSDTDEDDDDGNEGDEKQGAEMD
ncbi:uncharacterized protein A1O5_12852 [Cladophialophora psammophila CBS 110553]|uniref:Uncharacterized protein n=1 Tax=Cladophialophora psammophila CBS 110553 TaxID=1182543 RepID=W9VS13_9EURO|nr:uncharacterized protein A1O5_12852 [Cladophialophora psammophila CBS 110553]EXJ54941.1 hypothetical protein A1O5_12852 [Cladophialophora psammophila CBS 110553]